MAAFLYKSNGYGYYIWDAKRPPYGKYLDKNGEFTSIFKVNFTSFKTRREAIQKFKMYFKKERFVDLSKDFW